MRKIFLNTSTGKNAVTFIELMISLVVLSVLALLALPLSQNDVQRDRENSLRHSLRTMRKAIDRYWDEQNRLEPKKAYNKKYPENLNVLVQERYLRKIPVDPFTGKAQWQTVSSTDPVDAIMSNKENVFDVHSTSELESEDGLKYKEW